MSDWTAAWNASPTDSDLVGGGDEAIADTRDTIGDRLVKEHFLSMSEASPQPQQGRHRPGSAVSFAQATAPTLKPDGSAVLDAIDHGRTWIDTDTGVPYFWKWASGSGAWTECAGTHGLVLLTSGTSWTSPWTGPVKVTCVGGGGGSAGAASNTIGGGGGGGGTAIKIFNLVAGTAYSYAIGAAGVANISGGGEGGDTTFTVGASTITGSGGTGGNVYTDPPVSALGGSGSDGDVNLTGSSGGAPKIGASGTSVESLGGFSSVINYGTGGSVSDFIGVGLAELKDATAGCILIEW